MTSVELVNKSMQENQLFKITVKYVFKMCTHKLRIISQFRILGYELSWVFLMLLYVFFNCSTRKECFITEQFFFSNFNNLIFSN
jgi:hypothetical protein